MEKRDDLPTNQQAFSKWERSEERKEEEMKKRLDKQASQQKKRSREEEEVSSRKKTIQLKISESLKRLPETRKKAIEAEEEKERRLLLKEAKEELWKRWRQKKGRKAGNPDVKKSEVEKMEK